MRLSDAEDLAGLGLGQTPRLDDLVDLQCQARLQQLLFGMGQVEIGKDVAAPFLSLDSSSWLVPPFLVVPLGGGQPLPDQRDILVRRRYALLRPTATRT